MAIVTGETETSLLWKELRKMIRERGWSGSALGVEMDNYYYSAAAHDSLSRNLPDAHIKDATGLVNWQRAVKSVAELDCMRKAARIVERMHARAFEAIEPGMRKNEAVAELYRDAIIGVGEDWGDYPSILPLTPSGSDAAASHLTWNGCGISMPVATR